MKSIITNFLKKSPFFLNVVAQIHNLLFFNVLFNFSRTNKIVSKGVFLKNTKFKIFGRNNFINIHPECRLKNSLIFIKGSNCKVILGKHCHFTSAEFWIEDDFGSISIGGYTTIEGAHIAATESVSISVGEDCMFSGNIQIRNGDSHPIFKNKTNERINPALPVKIGNHVWLGNSVTVLKGTEIADNCIIATGAIVTNSCTDANAIYGGAPAKKIKENIEWKRHR